MAKYKQSQKILQYISVALSVAIVALMFVPWITYPKSASLLTMLIDTLSQPKPDINLLIFMIPLMAGIVLIHVMYIVSIFIPDKDPIYSSTVSLLLVGLTLFIFWFATDILYTLVTVTDKVYTDNFLVFVGADHWTWVPVIWFVLALAQSILAKFAHKKEVISYT